MDQTDKDSFYYRRYSPSPLPGLYIYMYIDCYVLYVPVNKLLSVLVFLDISATLSNIQKENIYPLLKYYFDFLPVAGVSPVCNRDFCERTEYALVA